MATVPEQTFQLLNLLFRSSKRSLRQLLKCVVSPILTKAYHSDLKTRVLISNSPIPGILPTPAPNLVVQETSVSGLSHSLSLSSPFNIHVCKEPHDPQQRTIIFQIPEQRYPLAYLPSPNLAHPTFMKTDLRKDPGVSWKPHICVSRRNLGRNLRGRSRIQTTGLVDVF